MIDCIVTLDYEIYGNGEGTLEELVLRPAEKLAEIFREFEAPLVVFAEAAELEIIETEQADPTISHVKAQLRAFFDRGHEIGLHLHPQWYKAQYSNGRWDLNYDEYNLCRLPPERIDRLLIRSIEYLNGVIGEPGFKPLSFRAGNWLLQPTGTITKALAKQGIAIDSSVFKGGVQHLHDLDFRRSLANGYYWAFSEDVNISDPQGVIIEIPTYTTMVPIWRMFTGKRMSLQKKGSSGLKDHRITTARLRDALRPRYPMKLDYSRLDADELIAMFDRELKKDRMDPSLYRPIVAIGHTKDLTDFRAIECFLTYLRKNEVPISTFNEAHDKIINRPGKP